ncbi:HAD family hydrolase [Vallitalea pronyensis]|uniref:HAD family hydrolase n=1 Tax=Vallitalea pronyensis TaxID=1348613 RepID=A0A8J8SFR7_9FIRM|nr:HAD family hydrolase [Vallitalea pronyensis]QUI21881.1 HAD family hydrolase [Vallitalea pronyensis]
MKFLGIKAICFDYYNTLVNIGQPFTDIRNWFERFLKSKNDQISVEQFNMCFTKQRAKYICHSDFMTGSSILEESYRRTCEKYNVEHSLHAFNTFVYHLFRSPQAYEDARHTIEQLKDKYMVALITNADNDVLYESMDSQGFAFDYVISSEDARCNKPGKAIFDKALQDMHMQNNELLMVGDSLQEDILGAKQQGINAIWVNRDHDVNAYNVTMVDSLNQMLQFL